MMKAIVYDHYGPPEVLQFREVNPPVPEANEVLVKVHAASVTKYDCWMRSCTAPPGFRLPMRLASGFNAPKQPILGTELSGEVASTGSHVERFKKGDQVFGYPGMKMGAHAEYICLPEKAVTLKPDNITHQEAAGLLQGALTALYFLKKANIKEGRKILIYGASGGVGNYAVQLAGYFGAEVTGVCSPSKHEWVKSLGARHVMDYSGEDLNRDGTTYDIFLDTVGLSPLSWCRKSLGENGYYILTTFGLPRLFQLIWLSLTSKKKLFYGVLKETKEDLNFIRDLAEAGTIKAVIDKNYPWDEMIEAHRYVETGIKKGNVIININNSL